MLVAERKIAGRAYTCPKLPADQGLDLLLYVSAALAPAPGLLEAIALNSGDPDLVYEFFDAVRGIDPQTVHALVVRLSSLPRLQDDAPPARDLDMENLAELALFAIGAQFATFFARSAPVPVPRLPRDPDAVTLSPGEVRALGPNILSRSYLLRPTAFHTAEPLCTLIELRTVLTLDDLADAHEAMDIREHLIAKAAAARPKGGKRGHH